MYKDHFDLKAFPFENTPNPDFFFMGSCYRDTLALMLHCILSRKGLLCITGPVGAGKTTLAKTLTKHLPKQSLIIPIPYPMITPEELLNETARYLNIDRASSMPRLEYIQAIRSELININRENRHCILIIDEAHLISDEIFQELLIFSNLETDEHKLLQILFLGQKELTVKLQEEKMRQIMQRISVNISIEPMKRNQILHYIEHRLNVAGGKIEIFKPEALQQISNLSEGLPRIINRICDSALMQAFIQNKSVVEITDIKFPGYEPETVTYAHAQPYKPEIQNPPALSHNKYSYFDNLADEYEVKDLEKKYKKNIKKYILCLVMVCICIAAFFIYSNKKENPVTAKKNINTPIHENNTKPHTPKPKPENKPVSSPVHETEPEKPVSVPAINNIVSENSENNEVLKAKLFPEKIKEERALNPVKYPYSILLASFQNLENTQNAVSLFRKKGIFPFWVKFDMGEKGVWFAVFTGCFQNMAEAETQISEHELKGAIIKNTKYAVQVQTELSENDLQAKTFLLSKKIYSFYIVEKNNESAIYVGAFQTRKGAQEQQKELISGGIICQVVER